MGPNGLCQGGDRKGAGGVSMLAFSVLTTCGLVGKFRRCGWSDKFRRNVSFVVISCNLAVMLSGDWQVIRNDST